MDEGGETLVRHVEAIAGGVNQCTGLLDRPVRNVSTMFHIIVRSFARVYEGWAKMERMYVHDDDDDDGDEGKKK